MRILLIGAKLNFLPVSNSSAVEGLGGNLIYIEAQAGGEVCSGVTATERLLSNILILVAQERGRDEDQV
jgi:hypothetical protein